MKNKFLILLAYITLTIVLSPIRALGNIGVKLSSLIGFILFALVTVLLIKRYHGKVSAPGVLLLGLLGISLINLPFHVIYFRETVGTLLEYVIHLLAVVAGYYYTMIKKNNFRILFSIVCIVIVSVLSFYIDDLFLKYIY